MANEQKVNVNSRIYRAAKRMREQQARLVESVAKAECDWKAAESAAENARK